MEDQIAIIYALINISIFLSIPWFVVIRLAIGKYSLDHMYVYVFSNLKKKVSLLQKQNKIFTTNIIYKQAWNLIKDKLNNCLKKFWKCAYILTTLLVICLIKMILSPQVNIFGLYSKYIYGTVFYLPLWIDFYMNIVFCGICLFFVTFIGAHLFTSKRSVKKVDDFINSLKFVNDSLCFDKLYSKTNENFNFDIAYIYVKFKNPNHKSIKKTSNFWILLDYSYTRFKQKEISFLMSYIMIWGNNLILEEINLDNYEEIYQCFVNRFESEIKKYNISN